MAIPKSTRRRVLQAAGGVSIAALAGCAGTGSDNRNMEAIVPYGPGGGYDTYTRLVVPYLEDELDATINVKNVEGGEARLGTREVYDAEPNGDTIGIMNVEQFSRQQVMEDPAFDLTEMTWFATVAENITGITLAPDNDIDSFDDYVQGVRNGELKFGAQSLFAGAALGPILLGAISGLYEPQQVVDNIVIYDGRGDMIPALDRGDIDVMAGTYSSILPFHESGDAEMFLVLTDDEEPPEATPDAETLATAGVDNATEVNDINAPIRAFAGPPEMPDDETQELRDGFEAAINNEEFQAEAEESDRPVTYKDGETTAEVVENTVTNWENNLDLLNQLQESE
ncbi:Bug family tripartite tricarboxylate transporter substrate binding protein [Natrinema soli]|uniref:Bug family tripartite tricarboxylate transporter substrate binding protein n=1 Tax=Natrinema soli TaxID=1930624 RepID=A0ABD5SMI2_9EURY|nr:tripartite tricarboxylate transporter substrate-binding protein [Natrinema soli]